MPIKVLYIENDLMNMHLIRKMFNLTDYHLLEAYDGKMGFEMAVNDMPDVILMDINLPDMKGIDLIMKLKQVEQLSQIPIIALTAITSDTVIRDCMDAGFVTVLNKPISRFLLLDAIRRFTGSAILYASKEIGEENVLKKVLIVEDNIDLRKIFFHTFDRQHFSVQVAEDGIEAIESLQIELPDVMILDINMPRLSGFEVLKYIRKNKRTKDIKVVVVTGNFMAMQAPEAEYADLLLLKPVNINDLITLAQRLIPAPAAIP